MSPEVEHFKKTLRRHAERNTNTLSLWGDQLKLDYATLYAEVVYRQERLRDENVKVVALALDNGVEALIWDLAALFEGLTCLTLPPFFTPSQRKHCLDQSQAELLIAEVELESELQTAGFEKTGEFWRKTVHGPSLMPEGTAKLTFTSGTTGTPKGVCLSAESIVCVARELYEASRPNDPQHHLAVLPLRSCWKTSAVMPRCMRAQPLACPVRQPWVFRAPAALMYRDCWVAWPLAPPIA